MTTKGMLEMEALIRQLSYCRAELDASGIFSAAVLVDAAIRAIHDHVERGDAPGGSDATDQPDVKRTMRG